MLHPRGQPRLEGLQGHPRERSSRRAPQGHGSELVPKGPACPLHPEHPKEDPTWSTHCLLTQWMVSANIRVRVPLAQGVPPHASPLCPLHYSTATPPTGPGKEGLPVDGKPARPRGHLVSPGKWASSAFLPHSNSCTYRSWVPPPPTRGQ